MSDIYPPPPPEVSFDEETFSTEAVDTDVPAGYVNHHMVNQTTLNEFNVAWSAMQSHAAMAESRTAHVPASSGNNHGHHPYRRSARLKSSTLVTPYEEAIDEVSQKMNLVGEYIS